MKTNMSISNMKKTASPNNVDAYLKAVSPDKRALLEKLRRAIKAAAPGAEEVISYRMPAYKYKGQLVYFAAFENHCSLFVASKAVLKMFEKELKPFLASKATLRFSAEHPLPLTLVKKIVKARMKENEARQKK